MSKPLPHRSQRPDFSDVDEIRRRNMAAISGKNTRPEMQVRRLAHRLGYRYRLHVRDLPGRPDIVFPARRKIIEIRGCFWHRHPGCVLAATPGTRADFWQEKFRATVARDARNITALEARGWAVMVIWECEVKEIALRERLSTFLGRPLTVWQPALVNQE
jgi:DNA mismatch endonuclease Vsr